MTISHRNVRVNQANFSPPFTYLACMAGSPCTCMYALSPDGTDSSIKVDLSRQVIRLSGNSTPGAQLVTSNSAGVSPAQAIIRLFGDVCDRAGPFLKFEKKPSHGLQKTAVRFLLKTTVFGFGFKTVTAICIT